jgi:hypothetical protein
MAEISIGMVGGGVDGCAGHQMGGVEVKVRIHVWISVIPIVRDCSEPENLIWFDGGFPFSNHGS